MPKTGELLLRITRAASFRQRARERSAAAARAQRERTAGILAASLHSELADHLLDIRARLGIAAKKLNSVSGRTRNDNQLISDSLRQFEHIQASAQSIHNTMALLARNHSPPDGMAPTPHDADVPELVRTFVESGSVPREYPKKSLKGQ